MMRGIGTSGQVLVGFTRSAVERLLKGEHVVSPGFDGCGPDIVMVFAEDDKALRTKLQSDGFMTPHTLEIDRRRS